MSREEKAATRYRAMFRRYPDALTPRQVQEMLGIGQRMTYGLLRDGKFRVQHGAAVPGAKDSGD